jgi:phage terminase large subunit
MTIKRKVNPNLKQLCKSFKDPKCNGLVLEGSSRSGKTWSGLDFLIWLCSKKVEGKTINIIRETYQSFKTTLYLDFNKRLPMFGMVSPFAEVQERSTFKLWGNQINLIGADKPSKFMGAGADIVWFNEAIHIPKSIFDQAEMRCSDFWFMDYNPEATEHWIYENVIPRQNVQFLQTTFLDNPFIPKNQKDKILSYNPTIAKNIDEGTADAYLWDVFGLGKRAKREGAIFKRWKEGKFNTTIPYIHAIDWGVRDPFTLTKIAVDNDKKIIYVKQIAYASELTLTNIKSIVTENCLPEDLIICDNSEPLNINELRSLDFNALPSFKRGGIISQRISWMNDYLFIIDDSPEIKREFENYVWAERKSQTPIDNWNHAIDGIGYAFTYWWMNVKQR